MPGMFLTVTFEEKSRPREGRSCVNSAHLSTRWRIPITSQVQMRVVKARPFQEQKREE